MISKKLAAAFVATALVGSGVFYAAEAAVITATYDGTVTHTDFLVYDYAIGFQYSLPYPGVNVGDTFSAIFTYDIPTAGNTYSDSANSAFYGGPFVVSAVLSVNGNDYPVQGNYSGQVAQAIYDGCQYSCRNAVYHDAQDYTDLSSGNVYDVTSRYLDMGGYNNGLNQIAPLNLAAPFTYNFSPNDITYGDYVSDDNYYIIDPTGNIVGTKSSGSLQFSLASVTVTSSADVPEPATWAVFLTGLIAMASGSIWLRRRGTLPVIAEV